MENKLHYEDLPDEATEFRGNFEYVRQKRLKYLKEEADRLAEIGKEFYGDDEIGCHCPD